MIADAVPLRTPRLDLEPLRAEHADEMAPVLGDPALYTFTGGSPPDVEHLRAQYRRQVVGRSGDGTQQWLNWVVRRRDTGDAAGYVQATVTQEPDGLSAEVAWVIASTHQGRGYAREAAQGMVTWLRKHGVAHVLAHVHADHAASQAVARAAGLSPTTTVVDGEVRWQS